MKKLTHSLLLLIFLPALLGASIFVDPTKPTNFVPRTIAGSATQRVLMATYIYSDRKMAMISGKMYRLGDRYGQFTITSITPYSVELEGPQDTREILFLTSEIKVGDR